MDVLGWNLSSSPSPRPLGDFNGDGDADILWQNTKGQAAIWLMNGTTSVSEVLAGGDPGPRWHIHALLDRQ